MLYGQSAGAIDTYAIATLPQAKSLINTAIMESGAGTDIPTTAEAQKFYEFFAAQLNCSSSDASLASLAILTADANQPLLGRMPSLKKP